MRRSENVTFTTLHKTTKIYNFSLLDFFSETSGKTLFLEVQEFFRYTPKMGVFLKTLNVHNSVTVRARGVQFCVVTRTLILRKKSPSRRDLFGKFNSRVYLNRAAPVLTHRRKKVSSQKLFFLESRQKVSKTFFVGLGRFMGGRPIFELIALIYPRFVTKLGENTFFT